MCLACQHEFKTDALAPTAFLTTLVSDRKTGHPDMCVITGICAQCLPKGCDALLEYFVKEVFPQLVPEHDGPVMVPKRASAQVH